MHILHIMLSLAHALSPGPEPEPEPVSSEQVMLAPVNTLERDGSPAGPSYTNDDDGDDDDEDDDENVAVLTTDEGDGPDDDKKKKKKKIKVKFGARVVAGARLSYDAPARDLDGLVIGVPERKASVQLRQARAKLDVRYLDVLQVRMSVDLADLIDSPDAGDVIRDAWGNIRIRPAFQIKVGNFKRPYSRFELRGVSKIPVIGRGLYNGLAVEQLGWGDRAVGVQLWGKHEPERPGLHALSWAVSASNDAVSGAPHGVDVHARVTYDPVAWLSIGASGAFKYVQDTLADEPSCRAEWTRAEDCRREVFGAGVDVAVRVAGLYASVEADVAQDWLFADTSPWMLGALAYASYDFELGKRTTLQPVVSGEFIDSNLSFAQSEAVRGVAGLNVLWTKHLRILPQAQLVVPLAPITAFNHFRKSWVVGLWVSVQL